MDRGSGILLHITSLPSNEWVGNLGPGAYQFADFLARAGQHYWQVLPLTPPSPGECNSPYSCASAFAGNTLLISSELLVDDGYINQDDIAYPKISRLDQVDYEKAYSFKSAVIEAAYNLFINRHDKADFERFCIENSYWLDDYSFYNALKANFGPISWADWPTEIRDRIPDAVGKYRARLNREIEKEKFAQYLFFKQWMALKRYCNERNIQIVGDLPIYLSGQSADVWSHPEIFKLNKDKRPLFVAGVPPDYFSKTGQLWGNPVYNWDKLTQTGYDWWLRRIERNLRLFDILRIDHFRGLAAYWEIPAGERTAINGKWVNVPGLDFFNKLQERYHDLPLIAEDLGTITPDVKEFIDKLNLPGMKVLLFAFGESLPRNPYAPHNHQKNSVVYTGTHDNNTVRGWFEHEATPVDKASISDYLGCEIDSDNISWLFIRMAEQSVADMAILPLQDILGLDSQSRMNTPSTITGNWEWRLSPAMLSSDIEGKLRHLTSICGRIC
jgi:4-alpha-glucanotransferase